MANACKYWPAGHRFVESAAVPAYMRQLRADTKKETRHEYQMEPGKLEIQADQPGPRISDPVKVQAVRNV